jgi:hypothetical protein
LFPTVSTEGVSISKTKSDSADIVVSGATSKEVFSTGKVEDSEERVASKAEFPEISQKSRLKSKEADVSCGNKA